MKPNYLIIFPTDAAPLTVSLETYPLIRLLISIWFVSVIDDVRCAIDFRKDASKAK